MPQPTSKSTAQASTITEPKPLDNVLDAELPFPQQILRFHEPSAAFVGKRTDAGQHGIH